MNGVEIMTIGGLDMPGGLSPSKTSSCTMTATSAAAARRSPNLLGLMKLHVERPERLLDLLRLDLAGDEDRAVGLRIGATMRKSVPAADARVRQEYSASPARSCQTPADRSASWPRSATTCCSGRAAEASTTSTAPATSVPGSGCAAIGGATRLRAALGASVRASPPLRAAWPSPCRPAAPRSRPRSGQRIVALLDLHRLPGEPPLSRRALEPGEPITAVALPRGAHGRFDVGTAYRAPTAPGDDEGSEDKQAGQGDIGAAFAIDAAHLGRNGTARDGTATA